jgi:hypothetical protein
LDTEDDPVPPSLIRDGAHVGEDLLTIVWWWQTFTLAIKLLYKYLQGRENGLVSLALGSTQGRTRYLQSAWHRSVGKCRKSIAAMQESIRAGRKIQQISYKMGVSREVKVSLGKESKSISRREYSHLRHEYHGQEFNRHARIFHGASEQGS